MLFLCSIINNIIKSFFELFQAMAAQKFREQKEEERRKRLEDMRVRDTDRRHQVEERKRQIWEAERDRREAILRKNQVSFYRNLYNYVYCLLHSILKISLYIEVFF